MIRALILLLFSCTTGSLIAQPHYVEGYYVTTTDDTVRGLLNDSNPFTLRVKGKGKIAENEYKSYYFNDDNRKFIKETVKNSPGGTAQIQNLEVLFEGDISLFSRKTKFYLHPAGEEIYYLSKRESIIFENGKHYLNDMKGYAGTMIHFMDPCIQASDFNSQRVMNRRFMKGIVQKYYNCTGNPHLSYRYKQPEVLISLAPFISSVSANRSVEIQQRRFGEVDFSHESGLSFGVMGVFEFPRFSKLMALELGFQTVSSKYMSTVNTEDLWLTYENNLYEKVNESFVNFGVRLKLPYKVAPYVFVGPELAFMNSDNLDYSGIRTNDTSESEIPPGTIEMEYSTSVGLNTGGGLSANFGLINPFFEYRIRRHANFASDVDLEKDNASLRQQNLIFGIRFEF